MRDDIDEEQYVVCRDQRGSLKCTKVTGSNQIKMKGDWSKSVSDDHKSRIERKTGA